MRSNLYLIVLSFFVFNAHAETMFDRLGTLFPTGVAPDPYKMTSHPAKYWDKTWSGRCFDRLTPDTPYGSSYTFVPEIDVGKGKYGAIVFIIPEDQPANYYDNVTLEKILNGMAWKGRSFSEVEITPQSFLHYVGDLSFELRLVDRYLILEISSHGGNGPIEPAVVNSRCYYYVPLYGKDRN